MQWPQKDFSWRLINLPIPLNRTRRLWRCDLLVIFSPLGWAFPRFIFSVIILTLSFRSSSLSYIEVNISVDAFKNKFVSSMKKSLKSFSDIEGHWPANMKFLVNKILRSTDQGSVIEQISYLKFLTALIIYKFRKIDLFFFDDAFSFCFCLSSLIGLMDACLIIISDCGLMWSFASVFKSFLARDHYYG